MVEGILIGMAVLCAVYFAVIVLYAGIGTSFAFIWLFFSALLLFLVYGKWYYVKNREQIPLWVPVSVVTTCLAGLVSLLVTCALVFWGAAASDHGGLDYVIVLGAMGKEHTVSDTLKKRLDKAIAYTEKNPDTILILSGGIELVGAVVSIAVYAVRSEVYENLLSNLLGRLALANVFTGITSNNIVDVTGIALYLSIIAVFVFLTVQAIQKRRWS